MARVIGLRNREMLLSASFVESKEILLSSITTVAIGLASVLEILRLVLALFPTIYRSGRCLKGR